MEDNSVILVPLKMEALRVNEKDVHTKWKDLGVTYGWKLTSEDMEKPLFSIVKNRNKKEVGIHLHWALPAALRHGIQHEQEIKYPPVPNRWLVIRTKKTAGEDSAVKAWMVESDFMDNKEVKNNWVTYDATAKGVALGPKDIGRSFEFEKWSEESKPPKEPLTALAPGNISFAAYYGNCRDVFGFHDPLEGEAAGTFSYTVAGWYSEPELDPLFHTKDQDAALKLAVAAKERPTKLWQKRLLDIRSKWILSEEMSEKISAAGQSFPNTTLCHSTIHSLEWERKGKLFANVPDAEVNIALGNTSVEAMSTLLARKTGAAEKLLSAYQYELLKGVSGLAEIQDQVHARQFSAVEGGALWEIQRAENQESATPQVGANGGNQEASPSKKSDFPDTGKDELKGLPKLFQALNEQQRKLNKLERKKRSLQIEFRATWDKINIQGTRPSDKQKLETRKGELKKEIDLVQGEIKDAEKEIEENKAAINDLAPFKKKAAGDSGEKKTLLPEFELVKLQMPRFWQPRDPSLLLSGPGVQPSDKYKAAEKYQKENRPQALDCRLREEIIKSIKLTYIDLGSENAALVNDDPFTEKENSSFSGKIVATINALYLESLLFDPAWAIDVAKYYFENNGKGNLDKGNYKSLASAIETFLAADQEESQNFVEALVKTDESEVSTSPDLEKRQLFNDFAQHKWKNPWTPLFLLWEVEWFPAYQKKGNKWGSYLSENWTFSEAYDYKKVDSLTVPSPEAKGVKYRGKTFLSDAVALQLKERLQGFDLLDQQHLLSQALEGFHDALLMKKQAIQLPLLKEVEDKNMLDTDYEDYITTRQYFLPDTEGDFFPIRAGHLKINKLWVVDAFGQLQEIMEDGALIKTGHQYVGKELANQGQDYITLPPRIIQPSRLQFRWITGNPQNGNHETDSNPATSPICGWIMPNHLDQNLMVFDTAGAVLGALSKGLRWKPPAGKTTELSDIGNKELREFIEGVIAGNALDPLLKLVDAVADSIDSPGSKIDPGMAVLVGQPLALVRASLQLERYGLPASDQSSIEKQPSDLDGVPFPVCLGDLRKAQDGLVGYFREKLETADASIDYTRMHPCFGAPDKTFKNSDYFLKQNIQLSFKEKPTPTMITLLLDPRAGVHVSTGILPTKAIELPAHLIRNALDHMDMHFLVAPLIGDQLHPAIPLARAADKEWSWTTQPTPGSWAPPDTEIADRSNIPKNDFAPQQIHEGFLLLKRKETKK